MNSFSRLIPYLVKYRKRLVASFLLGLVIAALWGANFTVAFPVVKVLLERVQLQDYVDQKIAEATAEERELSQNLKTVEEKIAGLKADNVESGSSDLVELTRKSYSLQRRLALQNKTLYYYRWLQHHVMPIVPRNEFQAFSWLLVVLLVATAVKGVLIFFQDVLIGNVAESIIMEIRKSMLQHVLKLDYQSLALEGNSGLMSRFTYDSEQLSQGITLLGGRLIREPLKCISCMVFALIVNWQLTLLSLFFIPLLGLFLSRFGKMLKRASRRMMESMSQIYKVLEETFDGLKVVIGFHNAQHHRDLFDKQYQVYFRKAMRVVQIDAAAKPSLEFQGLLAMFVAFVPGVYLVLRQKTDIWGINLSTHVMEPAELILLATLLAGMLDPCRKLSSGFSRLKRSAAALDRIYQLIEQQSLIVDPPNPKPFPRHSKSIEFRDISFRYPTRKRAAQRGLALEHVNLTVEHGEVVALVGQNGCGKSTLVNLLPRYYDPETGEVLIDGRPLNQIALADLRKQIGVVMQETILFDGTILDNIRYGSEQATREQIEEAARQARVLPIVQSMPQGFDTMIGDKGKDLSGGQRQRIALARMILRDPSVLILDEATSAADAESESMIHEALREFVKGRTTFLISHSISQSLLSFVTRIVVMENGKIVATGSHEELLKSCPLYHRLYSAPSRQLAIVDAA